MDKAGRSRMPEPRATHEVVAESRQAAKKTLCIEKVTVIPAKAGIQPQNFPCCQIQRAGKLNTVFLVCIKQFFLIKNTNIMRSD
jgi:hypothetical protein